jgi:hypothetical protein
MGTAGTWYGEMLDDAEEVIRLVDQIGAHDDRSRPYASVAAELRADGFIPVQKATTALANRIFGARQAGVVDDGIAYEAMGLLVDLVPYMRIAATAGVECDGGFAFLVARIEKLLGSMLMTVRSLMGIIDETPEIPW